MFIIWEKYIHVFGVHLFVPVVVIVVVLVIVVFFSWLVIFVTLFSSVCWRVCRNDALLMMILNKVKYLSRNKDAITFSLSSSFITIALVNRAMLLRHDL